MRRPDAGQIAIAITALFFAMNAIVFYVNVTSLFYLNIRINDTLRTEAAISSVTQAMLDAETGQRGFLLTSNRLYLAPYFRSLGAINAGMARLTKSIGDDALQKDLLDHLNMLIEQKLSELEESISIHERYGAEASKEYVIRSSGIATMDDLRATLQAMSRQEAVDLQGIQSLYNGHRQWAIIAMLGFFATCLGLIGGLVVMARREIHARRQAEEDHSRYAATIAEKAAEIEAERNEVASLNEMASFLQSCNSVRELSAMVGGFLARSFPGMSGGLYIFASSRNRLDRIAQFGGADIAEAAAPDACWGLRRGGPHKFAAGTGIPRCEHLEVSSGPCSLCHPLIAHGETVGLLTLEGAGEAKGMDRLAYAASQHLALAIALANLRLRDTLREQSIRDPLTGAFNRRYFDAVAEKEIAQSRRFDRPFAILMIDIDNFKRYNDVHGHAAGDAVLVAFCEYLRTQTRASDWLFRVGGEEFALLLRETDCRAAERKAEHLREGIAALRVEANGTALPAITVSMGIALPQADDERFEDVMARADRALYASKTSGRNRVTVEAV
ncbi:diguanylate cyclase [Starkeya koreensis]|uniref:diguanylate cyclase n=1 Tax=Ancylobacter koreensis TaxID=266121 RepID=A0ABT0DIP0_9HYPH|nr:diguanylate cyclase [Ancylobacter koreensis]MCK0207148.1 diguanylate cyclase [Ancylobacter koreensis]